MWHTVAVLGWVSLFQTWSALFLNRPAVRVYIELENVGEINCKGPIVQGLMPEQQALSLAIGRFATQSPEKTAFFIKLK